MQCAVHKKEKKKRIAKPWEPFMEAALQHSNRRKIARKTLQQNVGKCNVTTVHSWREGSEGESGTGTTCVCRLLHELLLLLLLVHTCVYNALFLAAWSPATALFSYDPPILLINHAAHLSRCIFVAVAAPGIRNENRKVQTVQLNNLQFARATQQQQQQLQLQFFTSHSKWHF